MSNKPAEVKKPVEVKKVYKVTLIVDGHSSTIVRPNLPTIFDKTTSAVVWLKDNGFKAEDINVIGTKPECWEEFYPAPVKPAEPTAVEKIAEVLDKPSEPAPVVTEPVAPAPVEPTPAA
jgi:hypothetical protein